MKIISAKYVKDKLSNENDVIVVTNDEGITMSVPLVEENRHYQEIQEWIAEGNTIEEAD
jgi:TPP-dependent 2-oxoacid decarboxylase